MKSNKPLPPIRRCLLTGGYCRNADHHSSSPFLDKNWSRHYPISPVIKKAALITLAALATGGAIALLLLPVLF